MAKEKSSKKSTSNKNNTTTSKVKVAYQRINGEWYAFAETPNGEIYFGKVNNRVQQSTSSATKSPKKTTKNKTREAA